MTRTYDPQSTIFLPRLTAAVAAAIGTQLLGAAAAHKKLAANTAAARDRFGGANAALQDALRADLQAGGDEPAHEPADRKESTTWSGAAGWLESLARMPLDAAKVQIAERLYGELFPEGLAFLRLPVLEKWTETSRRLAHIDQRKLAADFAALGGADVLGALRETHAATGVAAGITAPTPAPVVSPAVRARFDAWKAAVRCYVLQVIANAALADTAEATALAAELVAPLAKYEPPPAVRRAKGTAPATPAAQ